MGKVTGFLDYARSDYRYLPVEQRKKNFNEFIRAPQAKELEQQSARCMDCGIPFCHVGCPLGNMIPDFNHYLYTGNKKRAYDLLRSTNNFPSVTGRVCPAPCESACVLGINKPPVTIKSIEAALGDAAIRAHWDKPNPPPASWRTGKTVVVVGSGPAGLAAADQLNQAGHSVKVFERANRIGGLMMYGIPNFKLDKKLVQREVSRLEKEGVRFRVNYAIGQDISLSQLSQDHDAVVLAIGATKPRDLNIENRNAEGIHFAMDFLSDATQAYLDKKSKHTYDARGKSVLVIGGGDTGSDCIGTSFRQGAKRVVQIEIMPKPPAQRDPSMPWPQYDRIFRVSSSQAEGAKREFSLLSKRFLINKKNHVSGIEYENVTWTSAGHFQSTGNKVQTLKTDLVLLAMGFLSPELAWAEKKDAQLIIPTTNRGNISTSQERPYWTGTKNIFAAGDARRGQSLVVWAISEGRECARHVDSFLIKGKSSLPAKNVPASAPMHFNGTALPEDYEIS